jgi:Tfp pilus assembly protein PilF
MVRTFDANAFRQASQMLDEMDAATMTGLSPRERAVKLTGLGDGYLNRGLLLEAERLYHQAVAADPQFPDAHVGLGRVRQRSGDLDGARQEAQTALAAAPSAGAWVLAAELDLAANRLDEAKSDAQNALKIEPANTGAQAVLKQIASRAAQVN